MQVAIILMGSSSIGLSFYFNHMLPVSWVQVRYVLFYHWTVETYFV